MVITRKLILYIVFLFWVIFSIGYILYDIWSDFKMVKLNQAYQQGRIDTINEVVRQAQKCEAFPVFSTEKQVNLINVDCLKAPESK